MVLTIILAYLDYIFSLRGGMFEAYKSALANILPYLFANDNTHYSRWGTVHLHDMLTLKDTHPDVYEEFMKGNFVFHESDRDCSGPSS